MKKRAVMSRGCAYCDTVAIKPASHDATAIFRSGNEFLSQTTAILPYSIQRRLLYRFCILRTGVRRVTAPTIAQGASYSDIKMPETASLNRCSSTTAALKFVVVRSLQLGQMNITGARCSGIRVSVTRTSRLQWAQRSSVRMGIGHQKSHDSVAYSSMERAAPETFLVGVKAVRAVIPKGRTKRR